MAGSEAAWQAAHMGVKVVIHEMRPKVETFAHQTGNLGEMVCSNSFRSDDDEQNAVGLLHWEMRAANGLIMAAAETHRLPAGGALAVDREPFAETVTARLKAHPNISVSYEEITALPEEGHWIFATGPLTSGTLGQAIQAETGSEALAFFDAIAPIIYAESIDMSQAWMQSRYDKGETEEERTAYLNCPMTAEQYENFIDALLAAEKTEFHEGETAGYFDGCLPIEVMAERGRETLRFGPMKPVGLTNPHQPNVKAYAVVQLRRDNALGTLFNIVGFQTKMKYGAQTEVLKMIPGLENASFARLGGIHRNTFLNSPTLLDAEMRLKSKPHLRFAGQITGVEGYVESCRHGAAGGPDGGGRDSGARVAAGATGQRHGGLDPPHHRRCRGQDLSADECELWPVPTGGRSKRRTAWPQRSLQGLHRSRQTGLDQLAGKLFLRALFF